MAVLSIPNLCIIPLNIKITKNSFKKSQIGHKIETPKNRKKLKQSSKTKLVNFTNFRKLIFPNRKNKNKYRKKKQLSNFIRTFLKLSNIRKFIFAKSRKFTQYYKKTLRNLSKIIFGNSKLIFTK